MGKTLNKLNYLKETKSQIKTALNQFGAGITNDTFRSYVSKISDIYANWTKVTDEDSQINLTPTRKGKMNLTLNSTELTQDGTPSPSSPVDVNVITGSNNIKITDGIEEQNYPISLASKNLFDYTRIATAPIWPAWETSGGRQLEFKVKANTQYTLSSNVPQGSSTLLYFNGGVTATNGVWVNNPKTMTSDNNGILYVYFFNNRDYYNDIKNGTYYIQLEEGTTPTTYEPYYNLEYCKIGDYADQIFKNTTDSPYYDNTLIENEWYLKKNIQKTIINKNSLVDVSFNTTSYSVPALLIAKSNFGRNSGWGAGYTLTNTYKEIASTSGVANGVFASNFSQNYLWFFNNDFTSSQEALNLIDGTIVYIVRTTPTYIHITPTDYPTLKAQLEDIYNNSKSYNGQTNITQTNDDLPFNINASALMKGDE